MLPLLAVSDQIYLVLFFTKEQFFKLQLFLLNWIHMEVFSWFVSLSGHLGWFYGSCSQERFPTRMWTPQPSFGEWAVTACIFLFLPPARMASKSSWSRPGKTLKPTQTYSSPLALSRLPLKLMKPESEQECWAQSTRLLSTLTLVRRIINFNVLDSASLWHQDWTQEGNLEFRESRKRPVWFAAQAGPRRTLAGSRVKGYIYFFFLNTLWTPF